MVDLVQVEKNVKVASRLLKALSNEKRLLILAALHKGEKSVGALEEFVSLSQSALSQHLARLRRDGIVKTRRDAQTIYYSIKDPAVALILSTLCDHYTDNPPD
jgi:DNA-binding transcriptional ArsR family regulator